MRRRARARRATGRPTKRVLAKRLRFETLLSELSAGLIHVSAPDAGVAIERALRQVVTFLGVDRGGLDEHAEGRPRLRLSWARPGLERRVRSMLSVTLLAALGKRDELRTHLLGALNNGVSKDEIQEVLLHTTVYAGFPVGLEAFRVAKELFDSLEAEVMEKKERRPE